MATILHSSNSHKSLLKQIKIYSTGHESTVANKTSGKYEGDHINNINAVLISNFTNTCTTHMCARTHTCMHIHTCVPHTHTYRCTYTNIYTCNHTRTHVHVHTDVQYIHMYTHRCTHTKICTPNTSTYNSSKQPC